MKFDATISAANPIYGDRLVEAIGLLVWWDLADCKYSVVNRIFRDVGLKFGAFIKRPSPSSALLRACERIDKQLRNEARSGGDRYMLRPIEATTKGRLKVKHIHYAFVQENITNDITTKLISELEATEDELRITGDEDHEIIVAIKEEYEYQRETCSGERMGKAFVSIVERDGNGVLLRPGLYYVPSRGQPCASPAIVKLRKITDAIAEIKLHDVTAYCDRRTLRVIVPAIERRLMKDITELERLVDKWTGYQKHRLAKTKVQRINPIRKRIEQYENLVGPKFNHIKRECDKLAKKVELKLKTRVIKRPRLYEPPVWETEADDIEAKLNLRQRQLYAKMKVSLGDALLNKDPYIRNICDVALAAVAKDCGVEAANKLIEEFELAKECGVKPLEEKP